MAMKEWCGGNCGMEKHCQNCKIDSRIPCSPNCENLTPERMIKILDCFQSGCDEPKYIFGMPDATNEEVIKRYVSVAPYPY